MAAFIFLAYCLFIPYAELLPDDVQMLRALEIVSSGQGLPLFWKGWYKIPHGIAAVYIYLPLYLIWPSIYSPFLSNAVLNTASCMLLIRIGKDLKSRNAGIIAALLFFLNPTFFGFWAQTILQTTPVLFFNTAGIFFSCRYFQRRDVRWGFLGTLALSLAGQCHLLGYLNLVPILCMLFVVPYRHIGVFGLTAFFVSMPLMVASVTADVLTFRQMGLLGLAASATVVITKELQKASWARHYLSQILVAALFIIFYFAGAPIRSVFGDFLEMLDSVHSYNLGSSLPFLHYLRLVPHLERILWIAVSCYLFLQLRRSELQRQFVILICIIPLALYLTFGAWMQPFMIRGHSHLPFLFPQQYLLIGIALQSLPASYCLRRLMIGLVVGINVAAFYALVSGIVMGGRSTSNRPLVGEQFEIAQILFPFRQCAEIRTLNDTSEGVSRQSSFYEVFREIYSGETLSACDERYFYVRVSGSRGDSPAMEASLLESGAKLVQSSGRISILESSTRIDVGTKIYPIEGNFLPKMGNVGVVPGIVP